MKRWIGIILVLLFFYSSTVSAQELRNVQKQLENSNESIHKKKDELEKINKNKADTEKDIEALDKDAEQATGKLTSLKAQSANLNEQIQIAKNQIKEKEVAFSKENEIFKQRMRAFYITGNVGYIDVVLQAENFSDMLGRMEAVKKIIQYDKKLVESIKDNKKIIMAKQGELEEKKGTVVALEQKVKEQYNAVQEATEQKKQIMNTLQKDKVFYEKMVTQEEAESVSISNMIKQLKTAEEEAKKKAQEEAKKKAEEGSKKGTKEEKKKDNGKEQVTTAKEKPTVVNKGKLFCVTGTGYPITSTYGYRVHPVLGTKRLHTGIDIGVSSGTPVHALQNGTVVYAGTMSGYGNTVMISHGDIISLYAHNSSLVVSVGQSVNGGQVISYSGNTGLSSGPHLHFEIRQASSGEPINPMSYYVK